MAVIINQVLGRENLRLVGGKIKSRTDGTGLAEGKVVNIKLEDGIEVAFWDNETRELASRVKKAGVKVGSFISILATFKEGKGNAINFKYNGVWDFREDTASIKPTKSGLVVDVKEGNGFTTVTLDNGEKINFENIEKGIKFSDRIAGKLKIGNEVAIQYQNGKMTNFSIDGNWEITHTISAVIGSVAFIDETNDGDKQRVRLNISVYDHRDKATGQNIYRNVYVFFDNANNAKMVESVKTKIKPRTQVAVVGKRTMKEKEIYTGFYFLNL